GVDVGGLRLSRPRDEPLLLAPQRPLRRGALLLEFVGGAPPFGERIVDGLEPLDGLNARRGIELEVGRVIVALWLAGAGCCVRRARVSLPVVNHARPNSARDTQAPARGERKPRVPAPRIRKAPPSI